MWKCRLPARKAGKTLGLLVLALISVCVQCLVSFPLQDTSAEMPVSAACPGKGQGGVFSEVRGFFCFPQRFSNLLSDEKPPLCVPLLSACWKTVGAL